MSRRTWARWTLRTLRSFLTSPSDGWAAVAVVARARQQHAANVAEWKALRPTWWKDPADAIEVGAMLNRNDWIEHYAAQGELVYTVPIEPAAIETPPAVTIPAKAASGVTLPAASLSAGEVWAIRNALANLEGLGTFHKIRGD